MKPAFVILAVPLLLLGSAADQSTAHADITFDNQTSVTGELHVDGTYRCRAPAQLSCTVQVETGTHVVEFRFVDGDVVRGALVLSAGESRSIPVRELQLNGMGQAGAFAPSLHKTLGD